MKRSSTLVILVSLTLLIPVVYAFSTSQIRLPDGSTSADNFLVVGGSESLTITFINDAGASGTDVGSTIQYIRVAAANENPNRAIITGGADWLIYNTTTGVTRTSSSVGLAPSVTNEIFAPFNNTVEMYTWDLGPPSGSLDAYTDASQFLPELKILRPREALNLTITIQCLGAVGDSVFVFFFKASEDAFSSVATYPTSITQITDKANLSFSSIPRQTGTFWLPLHNSYDPYDSDLSPAYNGHSFDQGSWTRNPTTNAFSKANKIVHQVLSTTRTVVTTSLTTVSTSSTTISTSIATSTTSTTIITSDTTTITSRTSFSTTLSSITSPITTITTSFGTTQTQDRVGFHLCGVKFDDLNANGKLDFGELGINGVTVLLLGADGATKANLYYPNSFTFPPPEDETPCELVSGENKLPGSICFNLGAVDPNGGIDGKGTYVFYLMVVESTAPPDKVPTTPILIGPITLYANPDYWPENCNINSDPCLFSTGNNFGNGKPPHPVGGTVSHGDYGAILPATYMRILLEPVYLAISVGTYLGAFLPCCAPTLLLAYLALVLVVAVFIVFVARRRRKVSQS